MVARRNFVQRLAQVFLQISDLDKFLNAFTQMVVDTFEAAWASLYLYDADSGQYSLKAAVSCRQEKPAQGVSDET